MGVIVLNAAAAGTVSGNRILPAGAVLTQIDFVPQIQLLGNGNVTWVYVSVARESENEGSSAGLITQTPIFQGIVREYTGLPVGPIGGFRWQGRLEISSRMKGRLFYILNNSIGSYSSVSHIVYSGEGLNE